MQLSAWLDQNNIKRNDFAARIGVSPQAITGWCDGTFWIGKENAQKIFAETDWQVTPTDLMQATKSEPQSQAAQ
jgi:3,4-dihydroxy 2-butanone 4-phosphate synthase/GTP cyclohydrolase II